MASAKVCLVSLLFLLCSSWASGQSGPPVRPLTKVVSTSPSPGEAFVALTRETTIEFDQPIDPNTIDQESVYARFGGFVLPALRVVSSDRMRVNMFYSIPVPANAEIPVTIDGNLIRDAEGRFVDADADGLPGGRYRFVFRTLTLSAFPGTTMVGRVFASEFGPMGVNTPLEGVTITVDGSGGAFSAVTDNMGNFCMDPAPVGRFFVHIDGGTSTQTPGDGSYYPNVGKAFITSAGNELNVGDIFLPLIPADALQPVSQTQETTVTFSPTTLTEFPELDGVQLTVPADTIFANDGTRGGSVGIAPVPFDRLPGTPDFGVTFPLVITVQTAGNSPGDLAPTNFDTPVPVRFPNLPDPDTGKLLEPGDESALWSFDHDRGMWIVVGPLRVSDDGQFVESLPGTGLIAPGWHAPNLGSGGGGGCSTDPDSDDDEDDDDDDDDDDEPDPNPDPDDDDADCDFDFSDFLLTLQNAVQEAYECGKGILKIGKVFECIANIAAKVTDLAAKVSQLVSKLQSGEISLGEANAIFQTANALKGTILTLLSCVNDTQGPLAKAETALQCVQGVVGVVTNLCGIDADCVPSWARPACEGFLPGLNALLNELIAVVEAVNNAVNNLGVTATCLALNTLQETLNGLEAAGQGGGVGVVGGGGGDRMLTPAEIQMLLGPSLEALDACNFLDQQLQPVPELIESYDGLFEEIEFAYETLNQEMIDRFPAADRQLYYLLEIEFPDDSVFINRGRSTAIGTFQVTVPPEETYSILAYDPVLNRYGTSFGLTEPNGTMTFFAPPVLRNVKGLMDTDQDGLVDVAEDVIGTDIGDVDTDDDGLNDFAEIQQGLDPLDGMPTQTGVIAVASAPNAVAVAIEDNMAVVGDTAGNLSLFNVFGQLEPVLVGQIALTSEIVDLDLENGRIAVVSGAGVTVLDARDPNNIETVFSIVPSVTNGVPERAVMSSDLLFVGSGDTVYKFSRDSGALIDSVTLPTGLTQDVALDGPYLYVAATDTLYTFDIREFLLEISGQVSFTPFMGLVAFLTVGNGFASFLQFTGVVNFDVSDPEQPTLLVPEIPLVNILRHWEFNGSGIALSVFAGDFVVYDVSDLTQSPVFVAKFPTPSTITDIEIYNGLGYATSSDGLLVFNYLAYDNLDVPPTVSVDSNLFGGQVTEGGLVLLSVDAADDVQVRNVELLVDGQIVRTDGSFPFNFSFRAPATTEDSMSFTYQVRASDTGGNATLSALETVTLVPDTTAPEVASTFPVQGEDVSPQELLERAVRVLFDESIDPLTINPASAQLAEAGPDGILGNEDDVILAFTIELVASGQQLVVESANLAEGSYGLTLDGSIITDRFGNFLDGNGDGVGGDDFVLSFSVSDVQFTKFWISDASGSWNDAFNWSGGTVPGPSDSVLIDRASGDYQISIDNGFSLPEAECASLYSTERIRIFGNTLNCPGTVQVDNTFEINGELKDATVVPGSNGEGPASQGFALLNAVTLLNCTMTIPDGTQLSIRDDITLADGTIRIEGLNSTTTLFFGGGINQLEENVLGQGEIVFATAGLIPRNIVQCSVPTTFGPDVLVHGSQARIGGNTSASVLTIEGTLRSDGAPGSVIELRRVLITGTAEAVTSDFSLSSDVENQGMFSLASGTSLLTLGGDYLQTAGVTSLAGGSISLFSSTVFDIQQGVLEGAGTISFGTPSGGTFTMGGTFRPGNPTGTVTVNGRYTQLSTGTLELGVMGSAAGAFSQLEVLGEAQLDGTLSVIPMGYMPISGDQFPVLLGNPVSGSFSTFSGLGLKGGFQLMPTQSTNSLILEVTP